VALFRKKKRALAEAAPLDDHAVITHLPLSDAGFGTQEERDAVHEGGEAALSTYEPDADGVLDTIKTCLTGFEVRDGAYAIKRYGPAGDPDAREERVRLT
jgi:hypothetical protein